MSTIKAYTDLEQSKKLIEILPIDTADCCYIKYCTSDNNEWRYDGQPPMILGETPITEITAECIPCWSLAALLGVIKPINENTYTIRGTLDGGAIISFDEVTNVMCQEEEIIDAVFEMVVWLKEIGKL